jgi:NAD(P)-dependent dehydrogenase (short-subunit alcohol dehydrogenase family)
MTKALGEKIINSFVEKIPAGRMGTPDDIARAVLFFAGLGDYVTGTVMEVNGGLYT